jgi:hypothetical protein
MAQDRSPNNQFRAHQDRKAGLVVRSVGEKVWLCDSYDVTFLQRMGGLDSARSRFGFSSIGALTYEWISENNIPNAVELTSATLAAPAAGGNDAFGNPTYATALTFTVDQPELLYRGMVLWFERPAGTPITASPEYVWVSEVDIPTKTITVVRGWNGTPVYAYTAGAMLCVLTVVAEECHEFVLAPNAGYHLDKNYWQTFVSGMSKSKKYDYIEHYGPEDEYQRNMTRIMGGTIEGRKVTGMLPRMLEQAILYGLPAQGGPKGESTLGGINSFAINQVVVPTLTFDTIQDAIEKALMVGANIGSLEIVTSPALQRQISGWTDGTVMQDPSRSSVGRKINSVITDWGDVPINWHRLLRKNELYIVDFTEMGLLQLWEFQETRLGQSTSLCEDTMIDGCYGFALACPCHHTRIRVDSACLPEECVGPGCEQTENTGDGGYPVTDPGVPVA